jgi:hypothetical protein
MQTTADCANNRETMIAQSSSTPEREEEITQLVSISLSPFIGGTHQQDTTPWRSHLD